MDRRGIDKRDDAAPWTNMSDRRGMADDRPSKRFRHDEGQRPSPGDVGRQMLAKHGWTEGRGLGKDEQGRVAPVQASGSTGHTGLGRDNFETEVVSRTTAFNRSLESERIASETEEQRRERLERVQERQRREADVKEAIEKFRCTICNKQYLTITQYEEHCKSYDHNHKARNAAAKQEAKEALAASGELDKRREKERKREEKELRKIMGAAGVKVVPDAPSSTTPSTATATAPSAAGPSLAGKSGTFKPIGFKSGAFKPISLASTTAAAIAAPAAPDPAPPSEPQGKNDTQRTS